MPLGNLPASATRFPLASRPLIQQSSRLMYWYPTAAMPVETKASAVLLMTVSFSLSHPKLFHEFQPMGGVAPTMVDPPVPPVAAPVPPPVAEPPVPVAASPPPVAPASRPPAPPVPTPPAPPPVPVPVAPLLGAAPPVLVEPPVVATPPEPPVLPPVAFPPVEVVPPLAMLPPELVTAPPEPDVPPLAWPPPEPPFDGLGPEDPEQPPHTGARATTTDSSATFMGYNLRGRGIDRRLPAMGV